MSIDINSKLVKELIRFLSLKFWKLGRFEEYNGDGNWRGTERWYFGKNKYEFNNVHVYKAFLKSKFEGIRILISELLLNYFIQFR